MDTREYWEQEIEYSGDAINSSVARWAKQHDWFVRFNPTGNQDSLGGTIHIDLQDSPEPNIVEVGTISELLNLAGY